jgi:hypothetical protein
MRVLGYCATVARNAATRTSSPRGVSSSTLKGIIFKGHSLAVYPAHDILLTHLTLQARQSSRWQFRTKGVSVDLWGLASRSTGRLQLLQPSIDRCGHGGFAFHGSGGTLLTKHTMVPPHEQMFSERGASNRAAARNLNPFCAFFLRWVPVLQNLGPFGAPVRRFVPGLLT